MALDMAKMKSKLQELESGGKSKQDQVWWRPQEGDQDIRIVPTPDGDPFKVYHFHYNLGEGARGGVLCPKRQFGENCPICDFASKLWQEGTDDSNPFSFEEVKINIVRGLTEKGFTLGCEYVIMLVPNIVNITYGRKVGYTIEQEHFDKKIENISATSIRKKMIV